MPLWSILAAVSICTSADVTDVVLCRRRSKHLVDARIMVAAIAIREGGYTVSRVAEFLRRERSTVLYYVRQHDARSSVIGSTPVDAPYSTTVAIVRNMAKKIAEQ